VFIGIGSISIRKKIVDKLNKYKNVYFPSIIHPSVIKDPRITKLTIGKGVIICARTVLTTNIFINDFTQINIGCTISHDAHIGSFITISPGVNISGNVTILNNTFIGAGSTIIENITINSEIIVGAGSVVISNLELPGTYVGVPAKKI
jgi:sugar O-acyltransferase (sialic acid O-acetyltransferase NeuD family)